MNVAGDNESEEYGEHPLRLGETEEDEHALLHSTEPHPGQPWGTIPQPTSYVGQVEHDYSYQAPSALSPTAYDSHNAYDNFRPNNYDYTSPDHR